MKYPEKNLFVKDQKPVLAVLLTMLLISLVAAFAIVCFISTFLTSF